MDIITIGILCTDIIVRSVTPAFFNFDAMPVEITTMAGGDACNVALNAAAMGMDVALVSRVGNDSQGRYLSDYLFAHGVDSAFIGTGREATAVSLVMVEPDGERHFLSSTKILGEIGPELITDDLLKGASFLSLNSFFGLHSLETEGAVEIFRKAHAAGVRTAMDTVSCRRGDPGELILPVLPYTDIFMPSFEEARQIFGTEDVHEMAERVAPLGTGIFAVKLGSSGCYVTDFENEYRVPAFRIPPEIPISTVGAGDTFMAGFLTAQVHGMNLGDSAVFASAAASLTVRSPGANGGIRSFDEVRELAAQGFYA